MEDEKSQYWQCPSCKKVNRKSDEDLMFGQMRGISFGSPQLACMHCGHMIDRKEIVNGTYDCQSPSGCSWQIILIVVAVVGFLIWLLSGK